MSPAPKAVATTVLATTLGSNGATVSTVEHLLASVLGLGIDNLIISVEGGEIPDYGRLRCGVSGTVRRSRHP